MAAGVLTDLKIYDDQFYAGVFEGVAQVTDGFNAASSNALRMVTQQILGQYQKQSFWKLPAAPTRRDLTSVAAADIIPMTQGEIIAVNLRRKYGPLAEAVGALKITGSDMREFSFVLGEQYGQQKAKDMLNTGILAVEAAIEGQSALVYDATGQSTTTLTHGHLVSGMAKMGDQSGRIRAWVMHSKPYHNLVGQAVSDKITNVADVTIYSGNVATFGRPTIVIDAPALINTVSGSTTTYNILGLTEGAVDVIESLEQTIASEVVTGGEQILFQVQYEYDFAVKCKGFAWDTSNGGANPTDAALGTTTNWDKAATADKDLSGVRILAQ
ncbi:hypothetical protein HQ520_16375 [bacterium]|nr:hypothetical protein [bacterium]